MAALEAQTAIKNQITDEAIRIGNLEKAEQQKAAYVADLVDDLNNGAIVYLDGTSFTRKDVIANCDDDAYLAALADYVDAGLDCNEIAQRKAMNAMKPIIERELLDLAERVIDSEQGEV